MSNLISCSCLKILLFSQTAYVFGSCFSMPHNLTSMHVYLINHTIEMKEISKTCKLHIYIVTQILYQLIVYLGFYVAFNTVQVISRRVVGRAEETSTYSSLGFCTVNC